MIYNLYGYNFDFKNMWFYADFQLRKRHCGLDFKDARLVRSKHMRPNLRLIMFEEIKLIGGKLRSWCNVNDAWLPVFPASENLNRQLTDAYIGYIFENQFLK